MLKNAVILFAVLWSAGFASAQKDAGEWGKGIRYHTQWKDAIDDVRATGKLLFIYNGWQRSGI